MAIARKKNADAPETTFNGVTLTPNEGAELIAGAYLAGTYKRTFCFTGAPGIGKTSLAKKAHKLLQQTHPDFDYIEVNPTMPADEVGGIPELVRVEGQPTRTDYALPKWFPLDPNWRGIICLDDGLQGDRMMQQVLANLILARNLRGHPLPEGAMVVVTGNRLEDKAGVSKTLTHLADRMCWINIEPVAQAWVDDFAIPKNLDQRIVAYIMSDKSKLNMFDPNAAKCPTSRTWEAIDGHLKFLDTLSTADKKVFKTKLAQAVLGGELGVGEATRFWAFCQMYDQMPKVEDLLADPKNAKIDFPLDIQYAVVIAIANNMTPLNFAAALEYIDRIGPDMTTVAIKVATKRQPELLKTKEIQDWAVKNMDVVHSLS